MAIQKAAERVREKARVLAAHELEVAEDDLEWTDGKFQVKGAPDRAKTVAELAFSAWTAHSLPEGVDPILEASAVFDPPNWTFPSGTHICVVEVDPETGSTRIEQYVAVDDCGTIINPMVVDGQVMGGVAQGIAEALYEEAIYDENGTLLTGNMTTYRIPSAAELPGYTLDKTVTPSSTNPMGVKGIGETGTIAAPPAVLNAVADALRFVGVEFIDKPASAEKIWRVVQSAQGQAPPERTPEGGGTGAASMTPEEGRRDGVIPAAFDYEVAESADHAISLLGEHGEDAKLLAGGHSLLPLMRLRLAAPSVLVDIGRIGDLNYVRDGGDHVAVGALTTMEEAHFSELLARDCPILAHTAGEVGDPQVRHRGTVGGTVAHSDPASDIPTVLLALDATLVVKGPDGERTVPAADFWTGIFESALGPQDLLTEIRVPKLAGAGWNYQKFHPRAQDWAIVGVAAVASNGGVNVALTNMGEKPLRASGVEQALASGSDPAAAAEQVLDGTSPPNDALASSEYRSALAKVLTRRAIEGARSS